MGSFNNLFQQLPPNNDGKDFERLSKWVLETSPQYRSLVDKVWLWDEWPDKWGRDTGIDIVVRTKNNEYWAVQCKAYDPEYSVTKSDIDSFIAESARPQFSYRLLIATTDRIGSNARRTIEGVTPPCSVLLRTDLDSLSIDWPNSFDDFGSAVPHVPWKPKPHQNEALENIVCGMQTSDSGKVIMPCGSGKTLVALWASERLKSQSTLVLVPSISLMKQTIGEWALNSNEPMTYLAVCSDSQVTAEERSDSIVSSASDVPYPVTTEPETIARYLDSGGKKVVFSTYQSSPSVSEAQKIANASEFDLVIADEAHRCAGRVSKTFSTVLDNSKIAASKRIFMTATPRYFTARITKEAGAEDIEIASMDDPEQFGDTLYSLSFSQAISDDLLCDYQVVVMGIDDETVKAYAENGQLVTLDGETITDARVLASQIGMAKSMKKHDLQRVLTFHNRIKTASEFANSFVDVIDWMPDEDIPSGLINSEHVSGQMNAGERNSRLSKLRHLDEIDRCLVTNARCLAEGVDVPTLDAVGFMEPKSSQIDIVQAVGRVMRTAKGKTVGTIVIPVFIDTNDDPDAVLKDSASVTVWQVIKAIRSHDEEIAEILDQLRRESGRAGTSITQDDFGDKIIFDLPTTVDVDFSSKLSTRIVELATSSWEYGFGQLMKFVDRKGHARVPGKHIEDGFRLGYWVNDNRGYYKTGKLNQYRIDLFESLGDVWVWNQLDADWLEKFEELKAFAEEHGHCRVPTTNRSLRSWLRTVRNNYKNKTLDKERITLLENLPQWGWNPHIDRWEANYDVLVRYVNRVGNARPNFLHKEAGENIGNWVATQRNFYAKNTLSQKRIDLLEALPGWTWHARDGKWLDNFEALKRYVERFEDCSPDRSSEYDGLNIGTWIGTQRTAYKKGDMDSNRIRLLESLPCWEWDQRSSSLTSDWLKKFEELKAFAEKHGHCRVPNTNRSLRSWLFTVRNNYENKTLDKERITLLENLPQWVWSPRLDSWWTNYNKLKAFAEENGNCNVPTSSSLRAWIHQQIGRYRREKLENERIDLLEALSGWKWVIKKEVKTRDWLSFDEARAIVRQQDFKSIRDYKAWTERPMNIPGRPDVVYRNDGYNGMPDYLGYG